MKKILLYFIVIFIAIEVYSQSYYWERIYSQDYTFDIKISSNGYLFINHQGFRGIIRSTDNGTTWQEISLTSYFYKIAIDESDNIYLGNRYGYPGILKSTDYGNSWVVSNQQGINITSIYADKIGNVYAGGYSGQLLKSTDSGNSWSLVSVTDREITSITTISTGQVFVCTQYGPIFTSTDFGTTWTELPSSGLWPASSIAADSNDYLFSDRQNNVGISTDLGLTWNLVGSFPSTTSSSRVWVDSSNTIYYGYKEVYKSTDLGQSWISMGGTNWIQSFATYSDKIFIATYTGVYRYDPSIPPPPVYVGSNYMPLNVDDVYQYLVTNRIQYSYNYDLFTRSATKDTIINNERYFYYNFSNSTSDWIRYSEDEKKLFAHIDTLRLLMDYNLAPGDTFYRYDKSYSFNFGAIVQGGEESLFSQTYKYKGYSYSTGYMPIITTFSEDFAENFGVFNYSKSTSGPSGGAQLNHGVIMAIIHDSLGYPQYYTNHYKPQITFVPILTTSTRTFSVQINVAHQFNRFPSNFGTPLNFVKSVSIESFYSKGDSIINVQTYNVSNSSSTNWNSTKFLDTTLLTSGFAYNYRIVAVDKGIIPETSYSPDTGYYKCVWNGPTGIDDNTQYPQTFSLSQNYPNPFNPSTKISWQSPVGSHQTLKVYDVLGREVATLVNEYRDAGSYEVEFQTAVGNRQLASGVYYYQLRVGDPSSSSGQGFVETKKMVVIK